MHPVHHRHFQCCLGGGEIKGQQEVPVSHWASWDYTTPPYLRTCLRACKAKHSGSLAETKRLTLAAKTLSLQPIILPEVTSGQVHN